MQFQYLSWLLSLGPARGIITISHAISLVVVHDFFIYRVLSQYWPYAVSLVPGVFSLPAVCDINSGCVRFQYLSWPISLIGAARGIVLSLCAACGIITYCGRFHWVPSALSSGNYHICSCQVMPALSLSVAV
jgi:hypothetical protein